MISGAKNVPDFLAEKNFMKQMLLHFEGIVLLRSVCLWDAAEHKMWHFLKKQGTHMTFTAG